MWASLSAGFAGLRKRLFADHDDSPRLISRRGLFLVVFLVVVGTLVAVHPSLIHAAPDTQNTTSGTSEGISGAIATAVGFIVELMLGLVGQLLLVMIGALIWVAQYNGFVTAVPVAQGWTIVRDITNMFFIVIMLIYAFGTILGVDAYSAKGGAIVKLLIMAIVVNFSRTICGLLIDASQVVMLTFVYGFKEAAGGNFADALGITQLMQQKAGSAWSVTVTLMLALLMTSVSLMVVVVMTVCLAVRIVMLWLLIVLSPLAFLARSAPGGTFKSKYADWWKKFTGQLIFGPVMAFFLWLALVSVGSSQFGSDFPAATSNGVGNGGSISSNTSEAFATANIQKFIIAICLLFGGLQMAKEVADNMSVLSAAKDKVKGAYATAKGAYQGAKTVAKGGAYVAGKAGSAGIGLVDVTTGGRGTQAKNWALTQVAKAPLIGGAAEAKLARDKAANQDVAKKAAERAAKANPELVKARAGEKLSALGMDGQIERNEYQKKRVQDLAKKSKKDGLSDAEKAEYFGLAKSIKKHGKKFGDETGDKVLSEIEKKNTSLILDKNEKDPKERGRQQEAFVKAAKSLNKQDLTDMDPAALKDAKLQAFLSPKQVLEATKNASGENLETLENMTNVVDKDGNKVLNEQTIREYQQGLKGGADVFPLLSEKERAERVSGMSMEGLKKLADDKNIGAESFSGSVLQAAVAASKAGALADKIAPTLDAKTLTEGGNDLINQISAGISAGVLAGMSGPAADMLRERVGVMNPERALASGASMGQAFEGYAKDGNFDTRENRARFDEFLGDDATRAKRAGAIPPDAIAKNGGINDVSVSMVNNMKLSDVNEMAKNGDNKQASEFISALHKMAAVDTFDDKAMQGFMANNPGVIGSEGELIATIENAKRMVQDMKEAKFAVRTASKEPNLWKEAKSEYIKDAAQQKFEHRMTRKLLKKGPTSRGKS